MAQDISRSEVQQMYADRCVHLVDVSPAKAYRACHLPAAINIPIESEFDEQVQRRLPHKHLHVVVYSLDAECRASPIAALRMRALGYAHVYRYEAGKADWISAGLPFELGADEAAD